MSPCWVNLVREFRALKSYIQALELVERTRVLEPW
jgi:hypothetical protein